MRPCILYAGLAIAVTTLLAAADTEASCQGRSCYAANPCCEGFSCHPGIHKCYHSPRKWGEPCVAGYPCGSGLSCQPGVHKCYSSPRKVEEPCAAGYPCASGLTCEAGSHRCRAAGRAGDACHATRPCGSGLYCDASFKCKASAAEGESCHVGRPCGDGLTCEAFTHKCRKPGGFGDPCHTTRPCGDGFECSAVFKCMPRRMSLEAHAHEACSAFRVEGVANAARSMKAAMVFGVGSALTAGIASSVEVGVVYGPGKDQYGCYATYCVGKVPDLSIATYATWGVYRRWQDVPGESFVVSAGPSLPVIEAGLTGAWVWSSDGTFIGSTAALSIGAGILPFGVGVVGCSTMVIPPDKRIAALAAVKNRKPPPPDDYKPKDDTRPPDAPNIQVSTTPLLQLFATKSGQCLQAHHRGGDSEAAPVIESKCSAAMKQQLFKLDLAAAYSRLLSEPSAKCLQARGGTTSAGADIVQAKCSGQKSQDWSVKLVAGGAQLVLRNSGKCLAVSKSRAVQAACAASNKSQLFVLREPR